MSNAANRLVRFWQELKRRKVFRVIAMYTATAFIIIEAGDIMLPRLGLPDWTVTFIIILLIIGFPIVIILSWIFDITPEGLSKTGLIKEDEDKYITDQPKKSILSINNIVITILFSLVCILLYPKIFKKDEIVDTSNSEGKSIAVLPLINLSSDEQLEYFSDGVTQEIIDELAKVSQFQLSAFSSTVIYKGTNKSLKDIAAELDVSLILSGSTRIYSDSVRLSIELVNPETGNRIWGKTYDDALTRAVKIQSDIARLVAAQLNIELSPQEKKYLDKINTNNHEAFDLLLQAKVEYAKLTKEGFRKSIDMLKRAIELDPNYAQAYTLLAWIHIIDGNSEVVGDTENSVIIAGKVLPLIEKSISLDPLISDNYLVMGALDLFYLNNLPGALQNVNLALEMSKWPKVPTNYCICVVISLYAALGDLEKATDIVKLSKKIDRSNEFVFSDEGVILLLKGEVDQAIYSFSQALAFMDNPFFNYSIGWAYYHLGEYESALLHLDKAIAVEKDPIVFALASLSNTYFRMGNIDMSDHYRNILIRQQSLEKANLNIALAMISSARANTEEALFFLEKAYRERDFGFAYYLKVDPTFDNLRGNKRFIELTSRVGFGE